MRGDDYYELLNSCVRSSRHSFPENYLFEQDRAPPHTSNVVRPLLDSLFPDFWVGKHGPYNWPARSPDLSPPEFFLCGFVKVEVFRIPVRNLTQLKRRNIRAIKSIQHETLQKFWKNIENQLHVTIRKDGGPTEHL